MRRQIVYGLRERAACGRGEKEVILSHVPVHLRGSYIGQVGARLLAEGTAHMHIPVSLSGAEAAEH